MIIAIEIIKLFGERLSEVREMKSPEEIVRLAAKLDHDIMAGNIGKEEINQGASRTKGKITW